MRTDRWQTLTFEQMTDASLLEIGDGYRAKNDELGGNGPICLRVGHVTDTQIDFDGVERFHSKHVEKRLLPRKAQKPRRRREPAEGSE